MKRPLYQAIASALCAYRNCIKSGNVEWEDRHEENIARLCKHIPHGSGLDASTGLILEESTPEKLVFGADFHHMDEHGGYDGWSEHKLIVTASLAYGIAIKITGRDRDQIKDYIHETFHHALTQDVEPYAGHVSTTEKTA